MKYRMKISHMRYKILALLVVCVLSYTIKAQETDKYAQWGATTQSGWGYMLRAGYVMGGTTPLPLPEEIRSINKYNPEGGITMGVDVYKMLCRRWGVMAGLHFFAQGMSTEADVKNYHMGITQGEDYLEGNFTGTDVTNTFMAGFTLPFMANFRISPRWSVHAGPYLSYLLHSEFDGSVFDGYLREGNPTGPKVNIDRSNPATYDFGNDMRKWLWGVQLGFDWRAARHCTLFAALDWGMNGIFHSDFKTVDFALYPLYAKVGMAYHF